jgi:hypothetical protein
MQSSATECLETHPVLGISHRILSTEERHLFAVPTTPISLP